ncbi:MAG: DNA-protecting protein DprA [Puniceicoccaceae bacterium]|nr:MAG: DNA-protecting protein DprA [Puniceicoccaceae bacterium]
MPELDRRRAFFVLNGLQGIGPITTNRLLAAFDGDPVAIFQASRPRLAAVEGVNRTAAEAIINWRERFPLEREEEVLRKTGAVFIAAEDEDYPPLLREIYDPPIGLYCLGPYRVKGPAVAIVGSRRVTLYGRDTARRLAAGLARRGFCVVSGLARGIDTAAHLGALEAGGATVAVVGSGLDIIWPSENLELYRRITASGAVMSEFPFGRQPDRQTFPMRNRIVAGICQAIVVVESDVHGGAMITARFAGEQGRTVLAVPGRIDQSSSAGCHQLIRDGATLCTGPEDVVEELSYLKGILKPDPAAAAPAPTDRPAADPDQQALLDQFRGGSALSVDALASLTGKPTPQIAALLMRLELSGHLRKRADGNFEALSPSGSRD